MAFFEELEIPKTEGKEKKEDAKASRGKPPLSDPEKRKLAGAEKHAARKERLKISKADREEVFGMEPATTVEPLSEEEQVSRTIAKLDRETLKSLVRIVESYRTQQNTVRENHRSWKTKYDEYAEELSELEMQVRDMIAMRLFDGGDLIDPKSALVTNILRGEGLLHSEVAPKRKLSVAEEVQEDFEKQLQVPMEWARPHWEDLNVPPQAMYMIQQLIQQCRFAQYDLFEKHEAEGRGDPVKAIRSEKFGDVREEYAKKILRIIKRFNTNKKKNVNYDLIPSGFYRMLMGMEPRPEHDPHRKDSERHPAAEAVKEPARPNPMAPARPQVSQEAEEAYTSAFEEDVSKGLSDEAKKKEGALPRKPPESPKAPGGAPEEERDPFVGHYVSVQGRRQESPKKVLERVIGEDGKVRYKVEGVMGRDKSDIKKDAAEYRLLSADQLTLVPDEEISSETESVFKVGQLVVSPDGPVPFSEPRRVIEYSREKLKLYRYALEDGTGGISYVQGKFLKLAPTAESAAPATPEVPSRSEQALENSEAVELAQKLKVALDALWQQATKGMEPPAGVRFEDVGEKVYVRLEQLARENSERAKELLGAAEHLGYAPQRQQELEREIMERSLTREIEQRKESSARAHVKKETTEARNPFWRGFWTKVQEGTKDKKGWRRFAGAISGGVKAVRDSLAADDRRRSSQFTAGVRKLAEFDEETKDLEAATVEQAEALKKTVHAARERILLQFAEDYPTLKETFKKAKAVAQEKIRTHIALSAADEDVPEGGKRVSAAALERERDQLHKAQEYIAELGSRGGLVDFTSDIPVKEGEKERALNTPELKLHTDYLVAGVVGTELENAIEGLKLKNENDPAAAYTNLKIAIDGFLKRPMGGKTADKVEKFFQNILRRKIEDPDTDRITRHMLERLFEEKKWPLKKAA